MRYLGVSRATVFSPNRVTGDAAVYRAVTKELEQHGHEVICMTEQELVEKGIPSGFDGIFHMARSSNALAILEKTDIPVTNRVEAVINCGRAAQTALLQGCGLVPDSIVSSTTALPDSWNTFPCWIKRADSHAVERDDVQYIQDAEECNDAMHGFLKRGIKECVMQSHVKGLLVKFYGVRGYGLTDCYAATERDGKFGLERYNDQPDQACVDIDALTAVSESISELLGVEVYGGDAVVGDDGKITIIDFNDWPSFRTCTVGAAQKIAQLIMNKR